MNQKDKYNLPKNTNEVTGPMNKQDEFNRQILDIIKSIHEELKQIQDELEKLKPNPNQTIPTTLYRRRYKNI